MQVRLVLDKDETIRAEKLGIKDFRKKYNIDEIVKGDVIFCASGVTSGDLVKGIKNFNNRFEVTTLALHKSQKINKTITNTYKK
jgi:fructose-1,6-bisphosphatase II / sedoheptulose-1,7-bisphosphatase